MNTPDTGRFASGFPPRAPLEVNYTTTLEDLAAFSVHQSKRSPVIWILVVLGAFAVFAAIALVGGLVAILLHEMVIAAISVVVGVLGGLLYAPFFWPYLNRVVRTYAAQRGTHGMIGPTTLILSEDVLVEITATTRSEANWISILGVVVDGDRTYIMVTGMSCALLPRAGFDDPHEYEQASEFAQERARCAGKPVS